MTNYKELLTGHVKEMFDNAHVLQTRWERSRVQARNRSTGSDSVDNAPLEEVGNQNHEQVQQDNSR